METANKALNAMQQVIVIAENQTLSIANYLNYITEINPTPTARQLSIIEIEQQRLIDHINNLEDMQQKFAELLQHLTELQQQYIDQQRATNAIYWRLKNLELIDKDVLMWKRKAEFAEATRKLLFNELTRLRNGKEN